jgi:hypothetical protein
MGEALAGRVLDDSAPLAFEEHLDIASLGVSVGMPSLQARPFAPWWRLSPFVSYLAGLPTEGWCQAVRLGDLFLLGLPYDSGGTVAEAWSKEAGEDGLDLWVSSHCVAYCGYLSPDRYYDEIPKGYDQFYEWRLMNWFGPNQEALYHDVAWHAVERLRVAAGGPVKGDAL